MRRRKVGCSGERERERTKVTDQDRHTHTHTAREKYVVHIISTKRHTSVLAVSHVHEGTRETAESQRKKEREKEEGNLSNNLFGATFDSTTPEDTRCTKLKNQLNTAQRQTMCGEENSTLTRENCPRGLEQVPTGFVQSFVHLTSPLSPFSLSLSLMNAVCYLMACSDTGCMLTGWLAWRLKITIASIIGGRQGRCVSFSLRPPLLVLTKRQEKDRY
jgi:hypothetical protein